MRPFIISLLSTVQLTRIANAFAGVANLWFIVLWTRATELELAGHDALSGVDLWLLLGLSVVLGVGMSSYAGALNDLFDIRHDEKFAPNRPLPAGHISPQTAAIIGFASLLGSLLASVVVARIVGTYYPLLMCLLCGASILVFNAAARHVPSLGLITVGIIYASHMLMLNLGLRFIWPVLLIMVHAMTVHAAVYMLEKKRPRFTWLTAVGVVIGGAGLVLLLMLQTGHHGVLWDANAFMWYGLIWPLVAIGVFILNTVNKVRFASGRAFAAEKLQRYGAWWMGIYGVAWLMGAGLLSEAGILGVLVALGLAWMVFVRDIGAWIDQPVGYKW